MGEGGEGEGVFDFCLTFSLPCSPSSQLRLIRLGNGTVVPVLELRPGNLSEWLQIWMQQQLDAIQEAFQWEVSSVARTRIGELLFLTLSYNFYALRSTFFMARGRMYLRAATTRMRRALVCGMKRPCWRRWMLWMPARAQQPRGSLPLASPSYSCSDG